MDIIYGLAILIMSIVIHEVSHGYVAYLYGDPTAKYQGRLTLNPIKHLDPFGSVLLPLIMALTKTGFIFGWAKPVPYNPYNLKAGRWPEVAVALAGPASNILIAAIFSIALRVSIGGSYASDAFLHITGLVIFINLLLAVFNLVPVPPLDGSKLLFALFPESVYKMRHFFERWGIFLVLIFIFFLWQFIAPVVGVLFSIFTGISI